jgi:hypothetical protein
VELAEWLATLIVGDGVGLVISMAATLIHQVDGIALLGDKVLKDRVVHVLSQWVADGYVITTGASVLSRLAKRRKAADSVPLNDEAARIRQRITAARGGEGLTQAEVECLTTDALVRGTVARDEEDVLRGLTPAQIGAVTCNHITRCAKRRGPSARVAGPILSGWTKAGVRLFRRAKGICSWEWQVRGVNELSDVADVNAKAGTPITGVEGASAAVNEGPAYADEWSEYMDEEGAYLTADVVCKRLRICDSTLSRWATEGCRYLDRGRQIMRRKVDREWRYRFSDIVKIERAKPSHAKAKEKKH